MSKQFDELKLLQDSYLRVLAIYITWYTWFFGLNIIAFSWIMTSKELRTEYLRMFVLYLEINLALAIVATWGMQKYRLHACKQGMEILCTRKRDMEILGEWSDAEKVIDGVFATPITKIVTPLIMICFSPLWFCGF
jgi:hypothetical protein